MFCSKCGRGLASDLNFCPSCGNRLAEQFTKSIQLKCRSCNGVMSVDTERTVLSCPYCGSKELIIENDEVTIERIRSAAYKEVELGKQQAYREVELGKKEIEFKGRRSKFSQLLISFLIIILGIVIIYYSVEFTIIIGPFIGIVMIICGISSVKRTK